MDFRRSLLVSCAVAASAISSVAYAQAANQIEELVVTAERREQSLQDVPIAISAFTSERRDLVGINTIQDMTNFTPGLNYTSANDRASIRGIGRLTNQHPIATAVAVYDDGIFTTSTVTAGKTPIFTDRVEVLRGPQGTLYGRNSIGGAINVISVRPTKDFYAEVRGTYANYNHTTLEFAVSGPITDNLQARLAANWDKQRKGYYDNLVPGMPSEGNVVDTFYVEGQLQWQIDDTADVWLKVFGSGWNNGSGGPGARAGTSSGYNGPDIIGFGEFGATNISAGFACAPGGVVTNVVNTNPLGCVPASTQGPRKFATNWAQTVSLDQTYGVSLHFTKHFDGWDLKYIGGGLNYNYTLQSDNGGGSISSYQVVLRTAPAPTCSVTFRALGICGPLTVFPRQSSTYREDYHNQSHELNFSSTTDSPLQWIAGLYYYHEGYIQPVFTTLHDQPQMDLAPTASAPALTGSVLPPAYMRRPFDNRIKFQENSSAAYTQFDWKFSETLSFTAGIRYTNDTVKGFERVRVVCFATTACGTTPESLGTLTPPVDVTAAVVYRGTDPSDRAVPLGVVPVNQQGGVVFTPDGFASRWYDINFKKVTGTLGVTWQPDPDTTAYFRYGRGYKRGGISAGITSTEGQFPYTGPEYIDAFDAGVKKNWGRTLQTNVSLFYYPYKDLQAPLTVPNLTGGLAPTQSRFLNVQRAVTQGIEIETTWQPIDNLTILFNYSYTDAHVRKSIPVIDPFDPSALDKDAKPLITGAPQTCTGSGSTPSANNPNPNPLCDVNTQLVQRFQDISGNSLPQSPKHKIAANMTYTIDLDSGSLTPSVSYVWRDKQYAGLFERDYNASPSWDQVDARITYRDKDRKYTVIAFVKNLFDDLGYDGGSSASRVTGVYQLQTIQAPGSGVTPGAVAAGGTLATGPFNGIQGFTKSFALTPPRTYGVEVQYRF